MLQLALDLSPRGGGVALDLSGRRRVLPSDAGWKLAEVSGFANASPSRRAYRAVLAWLVDALGG